MNLKKTMPYFSVLMSTYQKDNPDYLDTAIKSIVNQSLPPNEIVLVKDGPLTEDLEDVIAKCVQRFPSLFKVISLEHNVGLGEALRVGLDACTYELVARMDADDISMPERFETQISYFDKHPEIDVLGSWIVEFENSPNQICSIRKVPLTSDEIKRKAQFRNPINHMTAMFRKSSVLSVGSYEHFLWFEDYHLWARMLSNDFCLANIPEILVKVRAGQKMLNRRGGWRYTKNELLFEYELLKIEFIGLPVFFYNIAVRSLVRIIPNCLRRTFYKIFLRSA